MKKLLVVIGISLIVLTGCTDMNNTPSRKVEEYIGKYQTMDSAVLSQLDDVMKTDLVMNEDQKKDYRALMEKQYQNMSYKIKDEDIDGDRATVDVEIEVFDFHTALTKADEYVDEHEKEFYNDDKKIDSTKVMDYKIKQLKDVTDKENYKVTFHLTKKDNTWHIDDLSDNDLKKFHGLYKD